MSPNRSPPLCLLCLFSHRGILKIASLVSGHDSPSATPSSANQAYHQQQQFSQGSSSLPNVPLSLSWVRGALEGLLELEEGSLHLVRG